MSMEVPDQLIREAQQLTGTFEVLEEAGVHPSTLLKVLNIAAAKLETASDSLRAEHNKLSPGAMVTFEPYHYSGNAKQWKNWS
jgi:hypothetical protein